MNDLIRDVLHDRADALTDPDIDLTAVEAGGRRARNRRRWTVAAGATGSVAAVTALAIGIAQLTGDTTGQTGPRESQFAAAFADGAPTYAQGSVVHLGADLTFDVGRKVAAMVQTPGAVVVVDTDGGVWVANGQQEPDRVGDVGDLRPHLRESGDLVAWAERSDAGTRVVALDVASGQTWQAPAIASGDGEFDEPEVAAVDRGMVWFTDDSGLTRWEPTTGGAPLIIDQEPGYELRDVRNGIYLTNSQKGNWVGHVGPDLAGGERVKVGASGPQRLSPDGRLLLSERSADEFTVYDTSTGEILADAPEGYEFAVGYAWADNARYWAAAIQELGEGSAGDSPYRYDLLLCTAPASCEVAVDDVEVSSEGSGVVLPIGERMD